MNRFNEVFMSTFGPLGYHRLNKFAFLVMNWINVVFLKFPFREEIKPQIEHLYGFLSSWTDSMWCLFLILDFWTDRDSLSKSGRGRRTGRYEILTACPVPSRGTKRHRAEKGRSTTGKGCSVTEKGRVYPNILHSWVRLTWSLLQPDPCYALLCLHYYTSPAT